MRASTKKLNQMNNRPKAAPAPSGAGAPQVDSNQLHALYASILQSALSGGGDLSDEES